MPTRDGETAFFLNVQGVERKMIKNLLILFVVLLVSAGFSQPAFADSLASTLKKAEQGDASANYRLGLAYSKGSGVRQDYRQAVAFFAKAAENGHADAQYELACLYYTGMGVERDAQKARSLYVQAAEHGNVEAQYFLARKYDQGRGVKKSHKKAVFWYKKAADQGHANAAEHLRKLCEARPALCGDGG